MDAIQAAWARAFGWPEADIKLDTLATPRVERSACRNSIADAGTRGSAGSRCARITKLSGVLLMNDGRQIIVDHESPAP